MWRTSVERIGEGIAHLCLHLAGAALLAIVAINGVNVAGRYLFGAPLEWAEEAMLYLMVFIVFAGGAAISWRGLHMRLEALIDRAPPRLRRLAVYLTTLCGFVLLIVISTASLEIVSMLYGFDQRSDALHLPMWIPQSFVLGGFTLFALLMVMRLAVFGASLPGSVAEAVVAEETR
ncbi:MAG: tripartite ATP-independent periplasmic transporter DctQ [Enterovirga sp.]|nr:tripartite ATP-independent periplasmic transporter DctQ [Enterovirga sp.]